MNEKTTKLGEVSSMAKVLMVEGLSEAEIYEKDLEEIPRTVTIFSVLPLRMMVILMDSLVERYKEKYESELRHDRCNMLYALVTTAYNGESCRVRVFPLDDKWDVGRLCCAVNPKSRFSLALGPRLYLLD